MIGLKPCPFCEGEAEFSVGKYGDGRDWHYVECSQCEAMGPKVSYADHGIMLKEALTKAWNDRAAPAPQPDTDEREALLSTAASLAAAISLLERGGKAVKKQAPSDKMIDQMLSDYRASLERARSALRSTEASHDD